MQHPDPTGAELRAALDRQEDAYRHARVTVFDHLGRTPLSEVSLTQEQRLAVEALQQAEEEVRVLRTAWRSGARPQSGAPRSADVDLRTGPGDEARSAGS